MAWLNTPSEIVEDYRVISEFQSYWAQPVAPSTDYKLWQRFRKNTWTTLRYVGCDYTAAKAKADELVAIAPVTDPVSGFVSGYTDVHLAPADAGQYHVLATLTAQGAWSAWAKES